MDQALTTGDGEDLPLFNQGSFWFDALPNLKPHVFEPLMKAFGELLLEQPMMAQLFSSI